MQATPNVELQEPQVCRRGLMRQTGAAPATSTLAVLPMPAPPLLQCLVYPFSTAGMYIYQDGAATAKLTH